MKVVLNELAELDSAIFNKVTSREPFDYTEWQKDLWNDKTVDQLSSEAMKHSENENERFKIKYYRLKIK